MPCCNAGHTALQPRDTLVLSARAAAARDRAAARSRIRSARRDGAGCCAAAGSGARDGSVARPLHPVHRGRHRRRGARDPRARGRPQPSPSRSPTAPPGAALRRRAPRASARHAAGRDETARLRARRRGRRRCGTPPAGMPASDEHFAGLGARHALTRRPREPRGSSSAPTARYTGPDCPPDMLAVGGVPQGDYAPAPWLQSSRGYAVWRDGYGNGMRFDFGARAHRPSRPARRPARCGCTSFTDPSPAARLRRYLRATGLPPVLPEWGYGFWKSRDVYEHQDDVEDDFEGCRAQRHPARRDRARFAVGDAIQHVDPQPAPVPRLRGDGAALARRRGADRRLGHAVDEPRLVRGPDRRPTRSRARCTARPRPNYARGRGRRPLRAATPGGEPFVARWWMGTGSPIDFTAPPPSRGGASRPSAPCASASRASRPTTARATTSPMTCASPTADGRAVGVARRRPVPPLDAARARRGPPGTRRALRAQRLDRPAGDRDALGRRPGVGLLVAAGARRRDDQRGRDRASRTGRTTSAATSATALVERCPPELLVRWVQLGCFTPLMQAHGRMVAGAVDLRRAHADASTARTCCCTSSSCPTCAPPRRQPQRSGLPIIRPLHLIDRRRRPRLDDRRRVRLRPGALGRAGARGRRALARGRAAARGVDRGVVGRARARRRRGRRARAARARSRSGCATASIVVTYPADARGARPRRHAGVRASAGGDPVGRAAARADGGAARRRHEDRLATRALVGRPPARRDVRRTLRPAASTLRSSRVVANWY